MKTKILCSIIALAAGSLLAADSSPKDDLKAAAKKLGDKDNYSWKTTTVVPESNQFKPGPTEGKTEKDGFTLLSFSFGDNTTQAVKKGEKGAVTDQDGNWQTLEEMEKGEGFGTFFARIIKDMKNPAGQVIELADAAKEIKKDGDAYSGDLTEDGAKKQFRFGNVTGAKGSAKFWVKDGLVTKFEVKLEGKLDFNGTEIDGARTTTTEIKEIGKTKVEVPDGAKKKLTQEPAKKQE